MLHHVDNKPSEVLRYVYGQNPYRITGLTSNGLLSITIKPEAE